MRANNKESKVMAKSPNKRLPAIAVEEQTVRVRVDLPEPLHQDVEYYARYFASVAGRKPRSMTDVIVGVLGEYLATDAGFSGWKRTHPMPDASDSPFSMKTETRSTVADGT